MFEQIPYYIPSIVCFLWVGIYVFKKKNRSQRILFGLLPLECYYFLACALYIMPNPDYQLMAGMDLLNMPLSLGIAALNTMFILSHDQDWLKIRRYALVLLLPSLVYLIINLLLFSLLGTEEIGNFYQKIYAEGYIPGEADRGAMLLYYNLSCVTHYWVSWVMLLIALSSCIWVSRRQGYRLGDVYRFFFCKATSTPSRIVCFLKGFTLSIMMFIMICGWHFSSPVVSALMMLLLALGIHLLSYVEYASQLPQVTLYLLAHADFIKLDTLAASTAEASQEPAMPEPTHNQEAHPADIKAEEAVQSEVHTSEPVIDSKTQATLAEQLRKALEEDQVYRDPELSIISLAQQLGTNRTTLSMVINVTYGQNFRQLLSNYRISAAKKYLREHPEATQDEVSSTCGFLSAQTFNAKFKEITGLTPRQWQLEDAKND